MCLGNSILNVDGNHKCTIPKAICSVHHHCRFMPSLSYPRRFQYIYMDFRPTPGQERRAILKENASMVLCTSFVFDAGHTSAYFLLDGSEITHISFLNQSCLRSKIFEFRHV